MDSDGESLELHSLANEYVATDSDIEPFLADLCTLQSLGLIRFLERRQSTPTQDVSGEAVLSEPLKTSELLERLWFDSDQMLWQQNEDNESPGELLIQGIDKRTPP